MPRSGGESVALEFEGEEAGHGWQRGGLAAGPRPFRTEPRPGVWVPSPVKRSCGFFPPYLKNDF